MIPETISNNLCALCKNRFPYRSEFPQFCVATNTAMPTVPIVTETDLNKTGKVDFFNLEHVNLNNICPTFILFKDNLDPETKISLLVEDVAYWRGRRDELEDQCNKMVQLFERSIASNDCNCDSEFIPLDLNEGFDVHNIDNNDEEENNNDDEAP